MAAEVLLYGTAWCPYCIRARRLLDSKGVHYTDIDIDETPGAREEMQRRGGGHTVPQIWIGTQHIGGCDDLHALDRAGRLDALLFPAPAA